MEPVAGQPFIDKYIIIGFTLSFQRTILPLLPGFEKPGFNAQFNISKRQGKVRTEFTFKGIAGNLKKIVIGDFALNPG